MKKSDWLTALTAFMAALLFVPIPAVAAPDLVDVCHHTADATDGREWIHIRVNGNSVDKHLEHGDVLAGESVQGTTLSFDDDCNLLEVDPPSPPDSNQPPAPAPSPSSEVIFAVAYSDMDPNDGPYNPGVDVLISKLVDGPDAAHDGVPGVGDLIITDQYPEDFGPTSFGTFGPVESPPAVTEVVSGLDYRCMVESDVGTFIWSSGEGNFDLYQEWNTVTFTRLYDDLSPTTINDDAIVVAPGSPSQPTTSVALSGSDLSDQVFIDVQADCVP